MRAKAFILFCCLLVYVLELVAIPILFLPASLQRGDQAVSTPACSRVPVKQCGAGAEDACCETTGCQNCPLGVVMTIAPVVTPPQPSITRERVYPAAPMNYWFMYLSESWKPPDVFTIAMNNKHHFQSLNIHSTVFNSII